MWKQEQRQVIYSVLVHFLSSWIKLHLMISQDILDIKIELLFLILLLLFFTLQTWVWSPLICSTDSGNPAVPVIPITGVPLALFIILKQIHLCRGPPMMSLEFSRIRSLFTHCAGIAPYSKDHGLLQGRSKISRTQFLFSRNLQIQGVLLNEPQRVELCALMQVCAKCKICLRERILPGEVRGATKDMIWVTKWREDGGRLCSCDAVLSLL